MVLASHDVQFVDSLCDRILELNGEQFMDLSMSYEDYLGDEKRLERLGKVAAA